jgi:chromatin modification-related protein VID21
VINIHESHAQYLALPVLDPNTLSQHRHESELRRQMQQQQAMQRDRYMQDAQRQRMAQAQMGNMGPQQQQQPIRPGPPGPPGPPGVGPAQQGQRMGPNGQPLPQNIAPSQQQILNAVAAATAANRQGGSATPGGSVRPLPQQGQPPMQPGQRVPMQQQMQQMEAQMLAAQAVQARAARETQGQRVASGGGGTPQSQPGNLAATPYQGMQDLGELMPNGNGNGNGEGGHMLAQSSPAMMGGQLNLHSSPQGRPGQMPLVQAPHLRAQTAGGSPQMGTIPQVQAPPNPNQNLNQAIMAQIVAQITANGGQPTPENVRAHMARYMHSVGPSWPCSCQGSTLTMIRCSSMPRRKRRLKLKLKIRIRTRVEELLNSSNSSSRGRHRWANRVW